MDRELERALLRRSLHDVASDSPPMPGEEIRVPVDVYLDPDRFAAERALLRRSLCLAAHRTELPAIGDFLTREVMGAPVLLVRDPDGRARAFLNVCRHRGATLERRASGSCKRFVCPYHAWTYRTDGTLDHVRHREAFPSLAHEQISLTELHAVEHGSFVWVCPEPGRTPPLDDDLRGLIDEVDGFDLGPLEVFAHESRDWAANWKLLVEGGLEAYHFKIAHRSTIGALFTDTRASFESVGDHLRGVLPRTSLTGLTDTPEEDWSLLAHANVLYTWSPNASVLVQDGHYVVIRMEPVAVDRTRISLTTVGRPIGEGEKAARRQEFLKANHDFTVRTLQEDFVLAEEIQRGLPTGANHELRFARFEYALSNWHVRLRERLADADLWSGTPGGPVGGVHR